MTIYLLHAGFKDYNISYIGENLGLAYISANLKKYGFQTRLLDYYVDKWTTQGLVDEIVTANPSFLLISFYEENSKETIEFINELRFIGYKNPILLGGIYATMNTETILKDLLFPNNTWCVRGEGEEAIVAFVQEYCSGNPKPVVKGIAYFDGYTVQNAKCINVISNLDSLPFPDRSVFDRLYERKDIPIYILSSRGCYGDCSFCVLNTYNSELTKCNNANKWREREISSVVDEIEQLAKNYPNIMFKFIDSNFVGTNPVRAKTFALLLKERKLNIKFSIECRANDVREDIFRLLKEVGLISVFIGIESGSNRVLKRYNKGISVQQNQAAIDTIRKLHIGLKMGFILFDESSTLEELEENINFLHKNRSCVFHPYRPLLVERYSVHNRKGLEPKIKDLRTNLAYEIIKDTCRKLLPYREKLNRQLKLAPQKDLFHKQINYNILGKFILFDKYACDELLSLCKNAIITNDVAKNDFAAITENFVNQIEEDFTKLE